MTQRYSRILSKLEGNKFFRSEISIAALEFGPQMSVEDFLQRLNFPLLFEGIDYWQGASFNMVLNGTKINGDIFTGMQIRYECGVFRYFKLEDLSSELIKRINLIINFRNYRNTHVERLIITFTKLF